MPEVWSLPREDRVAVAKRIEGFGGELSWSWLAVLDEASAWRLFALTVRAVHPTVESASICDGRILIHSETIDSREAAKRFVEKRSGSDTNLGAELNFELVGDHIEPHWLTPGVANWGRGYVPQWPEYYSWWSLEGTNQLEHRMRLWEPVTVAGHTYANLFEPVYTYLYAGVFRQGSFTDVQSQALVRLPYPVRLGHVQADGTSVSVSVEESRIGAAAGHRVQVSVRMAPEDPGWKQHGEVADRARTFTFAVDRTPDKFTASLIDASGHQRDKKEWSAEVVPTSLTRRFAEGASTTVLDQPQTGADVVPLVVPIRTRLGRRVRAAASQPSDAQSPQQQGPQVGDPTRQPPPDFGPICSDPELAMLLSERWEETQRVMRGQAYLAAVVMMGSLLEGVLFAVATKNRPEAARHAPKDKSGKAKSLTQWSLSDLIEVSRKCGWLESDIRDFSVVLRDYRNLTHPREQARRRIRPTESTVVICWSVVTEAVKQILAKVK